MDRQNLERHLGDEAVAEPSRKRRKSQHSLQKHEVEHKILLRNNITEGEQEEEEEEEEGPDWSEISEDILEFITARMHIGDRIQSSRVCKHWRSIVVRAAPRSHPASYGSPCLLEILNGRKRCTLTDPFRKERYIIDTPSIPRGVFIAHSNKGWLLMVKLTVSDVPGFFFNPLTQATIELPKLETAKCYTFSFSSEPTSSDCRVIGKQISDDVYSTSFCYWVPSAKEWKIFTINHQETIFQASNHNPFLLEDRIYYLDNGGRLGIYDLSDQKLTVIAREPPIKTIIFYSHNCHFVKMDDKLVFVYKDTADSRRIHLYEFDESEMQLIKLESIRGGSLFYCLANCIFVEATSGAGERIYAWDIVDNEIMMSSASVTNQLQTMRIFEDDSQKSSSFYWIDVCWIDLKS